MKKTLLTLSAFVLSIGAFAQTPGPFWNNLLNANWSLPSMAPIYMDVVDANVVWATGIYGTGRGSEYFTRTTNGGSTFNSGNVFPDTLLYHISNIDGIDANNAWVAAYRNAPSSTATIDVLYHTVNGGVNWTDGGNSTMFSNSAAFANWVTFVSPSVGIAMGDQNSSTSGKHEIWRTIDGGTTWTLVPAANIPPVTGATDTGITDVYTTLGNNIWYGTGAGRIFRSTDAGQTWSVSPSGNTGYILDIAFTTPSNGLCIAGSGASFGQYRTTDGGATWTPVTVSNTTGKRSLCAIPGTNYYASCSFTNGATAPATISISYDNGTTWNAGGGSGIIGYLNIGFANNAVGYAGVFSHSATASVGGMYKFSGQPLSVDNSTSFVPTAISTYPNPSNGMVTVVLPLAKHGVDIIVTDMLGNVVFTDKAYNTKYAERTLNLQHLAKGVYNLNFVNDNERSFQKIIIE